MTSCGREFTKLCGDFALYITSIIMMLINYDFDRCRISFQKKCLLCTYIYTSTKIDGVVCPPNISETAAGRLMKLAHRQRIASTTIKLVSKNVLLSILSILVKTIQRIVADPKRKLSPPFDSADSVPSLGHPAPGSGKMLSLLCGA